jgi:Zn-dependent peptidase ImmA (M78 family)
VDSGVQLKWRDEREAFRAWRAAVERRNVLVFQLHMPIEDARGFSLSDGGPFAIAVSSSDVVHARIFTLFHEYAHLLLRSPGVCNPKTQIGTSSSKIPVERWCNQFAAALLVPEETLRDLLQRKFADDFQRNLWEAIRVSSRAFRVSEQVALWRFFDLALITKTEFREMKGRLQRVRRTKKKGFAQFSASAKCFSENGRYFTSLVLEARGRNAISYADVADYLSLKLKHLPEVKSSLSRAA